MTAYESSIPLTSFPLPFSAMSRLTFPFTSKAYAPCLLWSAPRKDTAKPRAAVLRHRRSYPVTSTPLMWAASLSESFPIFSAATFTPSVKMLPIPSRLPIFSISWTMASALPKWASIPSSSFWVSIPFS